MAASGPAAPTLNNWLSILFLGVVWGGTFMVVRVALDGYGPLTVACARTTLGAFAMYAALFALRRPWPRLNTRGWSMLAIIGTLSTALPFTLLSWGQQFVPSAFAGIAMAILPLVVLPLAHFFSDEELHLRRLIGVTIGFVGALTLIGPGLTQLGNGTAPLAQLAILGAVLSYAVSSIMTRQAPAMDPIAMAAITLNCGAVILIPVMLVFEGLPHWAGARSGGAILFLGLFSTALATVLRVMVIRSAGSVFMTLVNYQVPLWSMLFGTWFLAETLPTRFYGALALILTGLAISQWGSLRRLLGQLRAR